MPTVLFISKQAGQTQSLWLFFALFYCDETEDIAERVPSGVKALLCSSNLI